MAQVYAPSDARTTALPSAAIAGLVALVVAGSAGMLWALVHSPIVLLAWAGAAAIFWFAMFASAADEE